MGIGGVSAGNTLFLPFTRGPQAPPARFTFHPSFGQGLPSSPARPKKPLAYLGTRGRHPASEKKMLYFFFGRSPPMPFTRRRLPLVTTKVTSLTGAHPVRSLPLKSDSHGASLEDSAARQNPTRAAAHKPRTVAILTNLSFITPRLLRRICELSQEY